MTERPLARASWILRASDFGFLSSLGIRHSSFIPERLHRIDSRRATRRPPTGGNQSHKDTCSYGNEGQWIERTNSSEVMTEKPRCAERQGQTDHQSHQAQA